MPPLPAATSSPRFTVVIPTFRRAELLAQALASVGAQTFTDYDLIVVDDDPGASSREVVSDFARRRPEIHVEYSLNDHARGGAGTRNAGLERAAGEWIAYLDDDDTWLPDKLRCVDDVISASQDPDLGLVYTGNVKFNFEDQVEIPAKPPRYRGRILERVLYENVIGGMSVVVAKRSVLQQIGGHDERFESLQDMELYVRIAEKATFDFVEQPLVRIRASARVRITYDPRKKLQGAMLFEQKYAHLLNRSLRLKHRAASRTFVFAFAANDHLQLVKSLPLTLLGLLVDPSNLSYVFKSLVRQVKARRVAIVETVRAPAP